MKKPSRKTLVEKLDKIFSIYIRRKDAIDNIATCVTCGKKDHWSKLQNGHWASRKHYNTRWDETNCHVQCAGCNVFRAGEIYLYTKYLCSKYGNNFPEELYLKSHKTVKFADIDLIELIDYYTEKVNTL
ncbi:Bacteriophage lambda NinG [uncultured Caudovirales phage]|uniref:Protein ninG n=1 Tax=uncultured Caudovirales phage TaxID=2100421 RepID=A0A6J7X6V9_9CAUD|nr:Bacteriophage lambda NinG [uncultured Caudovirales phage]